MSRHVGGGRWTAVLLWAAMATVSAAEVAPAKKGQKPPAPQAPAAAAAPAKPKPAPPKTHRVKKDAIKIEVTLTGVFEAQDTAELAVRPESWAQFVVEKAAEHGAQVKIDETIQDQELAQRLAQLSIEQTQQDVQALAKSTPLDLSSAGRAKKRAEEDLQRFLKVDKPLSQKSAEFSVKNSRNSLEYVKEELRQLEKMYKADDLTEETEEIILKRQRHNVERAEYSLARATIKSDRTLKVDLPRQEVNLQHGNEKAKLGWEKASAILPVQLRRKRFDLEKMRYDQKKAEGKLAKLRKDRAAMTIKAPMDGIVYYGRCVRGVWPSSNTLAAKLSRGGVLKPHEVFMTVVRPRPLLVRAQVPEGSLRDLRPGLQGQVVPTGHPHLKLQGRVQSVSRIPTAPGKFGAKIDISLPKEANAVMPGMACKVTFVPYLKKDGLSVPAAVVFSDPLDEEKQHVYVVKESQKPQKRPVIVGRKLKGNVEILKGLEEGDEILLKKPEG